ncbi:MAG: acetylserotonin O-methyltransferase [Pseudonocardia sp.]|nr:acetylserotonin O-methyltransferase [Pseudonocardia sp.]
MTADHDGPDGPPAVLTYAFSYFAAQITHAAAELGVADQMGDGDVSADEVAAGCGTDPGATLRLLRAMTSLRLVEQTAPDRFVLTGDGALLRTDSPHSVRNLVRLFCGSPTWRSWGELAWSVRTGRTAWDEVFGTDAFAYLAAHPEQNQVFNAAMHEGTLRAAPGIAAVLDLSASGSVVDIGGGSGALLSVLLTGNPQLSGVLFDSPAGVEGAEEMLHATGVDDRCRVEPGDFFAAVPRGSDAYVLKSVIHDWDDRRGGEILRRCHEAMSPAAHLYVIEPVVPEVLDAATPEAEIALFDLNMLVCTGGRERTLPEFRALLGDAGFHLADVTACAPAIGYSVLHAVPAG